MRSSNPALNAKTFEQAGRAGNLAEAMTVQGTVNKTALLLLMLMIPALWIWSQLSGMGQIDPFTGQPKAPPGFVTIAMMGGALGGFAMAMVTIFKKQWAGITAPLYAILQGFFIGGISGFFEYQFPGIVMQAVGLTFGVMFTLLFAYKSGIVKVTDKFRLGVVAATGAIAVVYIISMVMSFFGSGIGFIHSNGTFGIIFSVVVVGVAALNLVLDFDFIERGAAAGAPKYMEWYGAFGLVVTLVWLYLEILRLLSKLRSRN